jgi:PAS domain S-box-containing protein
MWGFTVLSRPFRRYILAPLVAWVLVLTAAAGGVAWLNDKGRSDLEHRFRLRVAIASDFVASYVSDLMDRERGQALRFLSGPTVDAQTFEQSVAAFGYPAAALVDARGTVLHLAPPNPSLIGADVSQRYPHLRTALDANQPTVSPVVASASAGFPVVSFAVPFETPSGRRVFSGAVDVRSSPLGAYLTHAIALTGAQVYLIDPENIVVGSNRTISGVTHLVERDPALSAALAARGAGAYEDAHEDWHYNSVSVAGTPWRLVAAVRAGILYQPIAETTAGGWVSMAGLGLFGLFGVRLWARGARNRSQLRESEERFRGLFDASLVGMLLAGAADGRLIRVNPALCELLGYRANDLERLRLHDIIHADDLAACTANMERTRESDRRGFTEEVRLVDTLGRPKPAALTATLVRGADARPLYFAMQAVDVSERHQWAAEQQRIRVELTTRAAELERANDIVRAAQQRTSDLVAMLSHDVRQPLGIISGYCELLLDGWELLADDKKRSEVARISRAGSAMMQLVEEVLTLTEVDQSGLRPRRSPIAMDAAVEQAVAGLGAGFETELRIDVEPGLAVLADARHLQQILINLLTNARKYGGHGPVQVQAGRLDNARVEVCVCDSGEGVPAEFVPHLFERFTRATSGVAPTRTGTGLGLYIVRELVEANAGTIRYEPNRPTGSRFVIELSADPARVRELNATAR